MGDILDMLLPTPKISDIIVKEISVNDVKWRFQEIYQLLCVRSDSGPDYPAISSRMKCNAEVNMQPNNFYTPDICEEALKQLFEVTKNKPQIAELSKTQYSEEAHIHPLIQMYREFSRRSKEFIKKALINNKIKNMLVAVESKEVTPETREKARAFCDNFPQLVKLNTSLDGYDGILKKTSILEKLLPKRTELPAFRTLHASLTQQCGEEQRNRQEALLNPPLPSVPKNPINVSHFSKSGPSSQFFGDKNVPKSVSPGFPKKPLDSSSTPRAHPSKQSSGESLVDLIFQNMDIDWASRAHNRQESTTPVTTAILPTQTLKLKKKRLPETQSVAKPTSSKLSVSDSFKEPPRSDPRTHNKLDSKQQKRSIRSLSQKPVAESSLNLFNDNIEDSYADKLKDHPLFNVLKEIRDADVEGHFRYPVSIEVPEYPDWIETPMDILTIEDLILNGNIKDIDDLECYAALICANACTYGVISEYAENYAETINKIFERYRDNN